MVDLIFAVRFGKLLWSKQKHINKYSQFNKCFREVTVYGLFMLPRNLNVRNERVKQNQNKSIKKFNIRFSVVVTRRSSEYNVLNYAESMIQPLTEGIDNFQKSIILKDILNQTPTCLTNAILTSNTAHHTALWLLPIQEK